MLASSGFSKPEKQRTSGMICITVISSRARKYLVKPMWLALGLAVAAFVADGGGPGLPGGGDPGPNRTLAIFPFASEAWLTSSGQAPLGFTNVENVADGDGMALRVDSMEAAFLRYAIATGTATNLLLDHGSLSVWVKPNS